MIRCETDQNDFPDREFCTADGVLVHRSRQGRPHAAEPVVDYDLPDIAEALPAAPTGLDAELREIRYQAEVSEVARLRAARAEDPDDVGFTVVVGLVGLALVSLGGAVTTRPPGAPARSG